MILSCSGEPSAQKETEFPGDEMVDIRIDARGKIIFNGRQISESALASHIEQLSPSESARARIILDETATAAVVQKTYHLLARNGVQNIDTKALGPNEFRTYNRNNVHIDVLGSGRILFDGHELHPDDLETALKHIDITPQTEFIISASKQARVGTVFDVKEALIPENMDKIAFEDGLR